MALEFGQENTMMEELPTDLMVRVLQYLDTPSRIKLARGNRLLQQRVYRECSQAWTTIDFYSHGNTFVRGRLTDMDLSNLLVRVNAIYVTKRLALTHCSKIRGQGLVPLRHSPTLHILDVFGTAVESNRAVVMRILMSMIPFKLLEVVFPHDESACFLQLNRSLRHARFEQAKNAGILCTCCHEPVVKKTGQIVASKHIWPSMQCRNCFRYFCRRVGCPMVVTECEHCGEAYCQDCDKAGKCYVCKRSSCFGCTSIYSCDECGKLSCLGCRGVSTCSGGGCWKDVCFECGTTNPKVCSNGCVFCNSCQENGRVCAKCTEKVCFKCMKRAQVCSLCSKTYCGKPSCVDCIRMCGACDDVFCAECKDSEHCGRCNMDFCTAHNRLVDCDACKMRHCRYCRGAEHCSLCTSSCYEGCACEDGRPAKKPKLSSMP